MSSSSAVVVIDNTINSSILNKTDDDDFERAALIDKSQQQAQQQQVNIEMTDLKQQQQKHQSVDEEAQLKLVRNGGRNRFKTSYLIDEFSTRNNLDLDKKYKRSYLAITRLIFTSYVFYLIIYSICWIIYYTIDNTFYINQQQNNIIQFNLFNNNSSSGSGSGDDQNQNQNVNLVQSTSNLLIYTFSVYLAFLLIIFIFLLIFEFKESRYKQAKNDLKQRILETKVDKTLAENNFKKAIQVYMENKQKVEEMSKNLDLDHSHSLSKLRRVYSRFSQKFAIFIIVYICVVNLLAFKYKPHALTFIGHTVWYIEIVLILYCMYPFNIYLKLVFAIIFSIVYEIVSLSEQCGHFKQQSSSSILLYVLIKILFNVILHLIGTYLYSFLEILKRNTFLNVCNMNLTYFNAESNKNITDTMIKSIMPPLFTHIFGKPEEFKKSVLTVHIMRPLYVYPVDNISILFADIVGFTKMSSKKTAEELVFLLNDLYGRFDRLCEKVGCEKISTLGDCYYCVSGCLNGRADHAKCCVEMGLSMIKEIESFNKQHAVEVNMRVGVHTGKALCGFIGGKRFRFDVWSSDVSFANKMESTGRAGWVHISQWTYDQLNNAYETEKDETKIEGKCTYFVIPDEERKLKKPTVADTLQQEQEKQKQEEAVVILPTVESSGSIDTTTVNNTTAAQQHKNSDGALSAIKNIEFFRPDVNLLTMCFNYRLERKYYQFLMGYNYFQRDRQLEDRGDTCKISTKKWSNPRNILFVSIILSFLVNLLNILSYTSLYMSFEYTNLHVLTLILAFCFIISLQLALVLVYFYKYTTFFKLNKYLTSIFSTHQYQHAPAASVPSATTANSNNNTVTVSNNNGNRYKHSSSSTATTGTGTTMSNSNSKAAQKSSLKKYLVVHLMSILYLALTPVVIFLFSFVLNRSSPNNEQLFLLYSSLTFIFTILQFCTFIQLNNIFKTLLMTAYTVIYCVFAIIGFNYNKNSETTIVPPAAASVNESSAVITVLKTTNLTLFSLDTDSVDYYKTYFQSTNTDYVIIIDMLFFLLLAYLINRQFELVQRVCFQCDQDAYVQINATKDQKDLANWLIDVVIPAHVVEHVKAKKQYSRNYECVGVLFVNLCNFAEFYEESFQGGRELLRVLNEISIDFEQLLDDSRYRNIEKIKSIGSTFMIASGLLVENDDTTISAEKKYQHLYDLVDFALKLWEKLESFNRDAMSVCHFKFQMRMGLNFGPVTAGVIGKDCLLYDIWGDTVNVASRMDSTGQEGYLQTPESAASFLSNKYLFHYRDKIKVKGKDEMITYLLKPSENHDTNHAVGMLPKA